MTCTVGALFVDPHGPYANQPGVEVWDEARDARLYRGPHPVVGHPPCERWGRYWGGGPSAKTPRLLGDDGGCFASCLASVRAWGGVLEHPADSHAWAAFDLIAPPVDGGWVVADWRGGWTCRVDQAHFGHPARKATWLYAVSRWLPSLSWERAKGERRVDAGCHTAEERARAKAGGERRDVEHLSKRERRITPPAFRDMLLDLARRSRGAT